MTVWFVALLCAVPARAQTGDGSAEKLRKLDIMLMVTALRCRATAENFEVDYDNFSRNQLPIMHDAYVELKDSLMVSLGDKEATRALDRISTGMANSYGQGHPWLDCAQLHAVARGLAEVKGRDTLVEAADQLLQRRPPIIFALASR